MKALVRSCALVIMVLAPGCLHGPLPPGAEAWSLLGDPLTPPPPKPEALAGLEARAQEARAAYEREPTNVDAAIWYGRRTAYLGRYRQAIDLFSQALERHPKEPRLYRHRGHRLITVRRLDEAIRDLRHATTLISATPDEVEPDGMPNASGIPTSTLQSNIWYHLGLAHYLKGELEPALAAYRRCMEVSNNPDMKVATSHWLYLTLRRLRRDTEAAEVLRPIRADWIVLENEGYFKLLLLYKGELTPDALPAQDDASVGYGLGNWHLYNGRREEAVATFRRVL
jgi:tetratricopeptide (TPR) repeat protein